MLGVVWAVWHAPATVVATAEFARTGGSPPATLARLVVSTVATSVVATVVYNGSRGSVPFAVLFHWLNNLDYPWEAGGTVPLAQDLLTAAVAAAAVTVFGRRYLGREGLATDVLGDTDRVGRRD